MFFWIGNSVVALLFLALAIIGIRQRASMFAIINFIGMALDALIVLLDVMGHLNTIILFWAMPGLAFVLATAMALVFRELPGSQLRPGAVKNPKAAVAKGNVREERVIVVNEKRLARELSRDSSLAPASRAKAMDWWKRGNAAFLQHDFAAAEACYERSVKLAPTPSALSNLAGVLIATSRAEAALQRCEAARALDSEHGEAWISHGSALLALARPEEALTCLDRAAALQPNSLAPWIYRGKALRKLRRFRQAVESCDTALRINPNRPECWHEKALALMDLSEMEQALKCFDQALEIDPEYLYAALERGLVLERLGQVEKAKASYRDFLRQAPQEMNGRAENLRARLRHLENKTVEADRPHRH